MVKKEFESLSEKRKELLKHTEDALNVNAITAEDIFEQIEQQDKEFIKKLKECDWVMQTQIDDINALAGPDLISAQSNTKELKGGNNKDGYERD